MVKKTETKNNKAKTNIKKIKQEKQIIKKQQLE